MAISFVPNGDRILILPDPAKETTESGLFLPEDAQEKPQAGTVVLAGKGRVTDTGVLIPTTTKAGDRVSYGRFSGTKLKIGNTELLLIKESDIYGTFVEDAQA